MTTAYAGKARWYDLVYPSERNYQLHERLGLMLFTQLVPAQGVSWVFSDPKATDELTNLLTGHIEDSGIIGDLVKQADMASAASSKGGNVERLSQRQRPLYQHMLNTLRMMIDNGQVPLNRKGGAGFLVDDDLWLMGSRVVEMIKEQLVSEGVSVPQNNSRLFDTLQEVNFIVPNEDHAFWYVNLEIGDWKPTNDFSMLRMPVSILGANIVDQLTQLDGKLSIVNRQSGNSEDTQPDNIKVEDSPKNSSSDSDDQPPTDTHTLKRKKKRVSSDESGDGNPPIALDVSQEIPADSKTDKAVSDIDATINHSQGTAFIDWTKESLMNGTLKYNLIDAKVHVVNEGVLLVSPAIFKLFAAENPLVGKWDNVHRNFQRMGINIKE